MGQWSAASQRIFLQEPGGRRHSRAGEPYAEPTRPALCREHPFMYPFCAPNPPASGTPPPYGRTAPAPCHATRLPPTTSGAAPGRTSQARWVRSDRSFLGGWVVGRADRPRHGPGEARARTTGRWPFTPSHTGSSLRHRPRGSVCWAAMSRRCGPPPARRRPGAAPQPGP